MRKWLTPLAVDNWSRFVVVAMYALKARDKLHKREKEERKEREKEALRRSRELDAYHRGEAGHDPEVAAAGRRQPATTRREAKVIK